MRAARFRPNIEQRIVTALTSRYSIGRLENLKINFDQLVRPIELRSHPRQSPRSRVCHTRNRRALRCDVRASGPARAVALHRHGRRTVEAAIVTRPLARGDSSSRATSRSSAGRRANSPPSPGLRGGHRRTRGAHERARGPRLARVRPDEAGAREEERDRRCCIYKVPGIVLTMRGKALESGTEGDLVNVLNPVEAHHPGRHHGGRPYHDPGFRDRAPRRRIRHRVTTTTVSAMSNRPRLPISLAVVLAGGLLGGCSALDRLKNVGEQPSLSAIENPTAQPGYKPVQMPMPAPQPAVFNPNSLWRNGSRAFFKDQRAMQVGDIMTVKVKITDNGQVRERHQRSRSNKEDRHQRFHRHQDHHSIVHRSCRARSRPPTRRRAAKARDR